MADVTFLFSGSPEQDLPQLEGVPPEVAASLLGPSLRAFARHMSKGDQFQRCERVFRLARYGVVIMKQFPELSDIVRDVVIPALLESADDADPQVRKAADDTLAELQPMCP